MATKPWEKAPERRRGRSKLSVLFQLFVAYIAYLALWKCPVNQPLACNCAPCETLHSVYDSHVAPLWTEYGQPYYEKLEPVATPLIAKFEPVYHQVSQSLKAKVEPHYYQFKSAVLARLEPLVPHWTVVKAQIQKHWATIQPHARKAYTKVVAYSKVAYAKVVELYFAHVAPKLSVYLRELDRKLVEIAGKVSTWATEKYKDALNQALGWLSEKVQNTLSRSAATPETDPSATTETGTPQDASSTAMAATTTFEATDSVKLTVPADAQDADDYIQESSSSSSSLHFSSSTRKRIPTPESETLYHPKVAKGHGPVVRNGDDLKLKGDKDLKHKSDAKEPASGDSSSRAPKSRPSWSARVARTAKSANKNLDVDSKEFQEKVIEEAKPEIMKKLRALSAYGEERVKSLASLVVSIEADEADISDPADIYDQFDTAAQQLQSQMMGVRANCESLAQSVIDKVGEFRKEALESLDDFFEIVLVEAGKDAAEIEDEDDEWKNWQSYSKLKKQLVEVRKQVEDHETDMETVNVALRESQQAAILLTQEFIQHLKTLRARAQFHIQQKAVLEAKKRQDEEIDASWYVVEKEDDDIQQPLQDYRPIDEEVEITETPDESLVTSEEIEEPEEPVDLPDLVDDSDSDFELSEPETIADSEETETLFLTETVFQTRINTHATV